DVQRPRRAPAPRSRPAGGPVQPAEARHRRRMTSAGELWHGSSAMTHTFRAFAAAAAVCGLAACQQPSAAPAVGSREWPLYGGPQGTRYSPLTQIDRSNVSRLEVAWTFDSGEAGGLQTQPIMIDGTVY